MANFNLADYETVDSRIKRFYEDNPTGRITTELIDFEGDPGKTRWIVKASIFRGPLYEALTAPDGTGYAFENDGDGMANKTSALENCETSAIGRALANIGYSGSKRPSQEEMRKSATPAPAEDAGYEMVVTEWVEALSDADSVAKLQAAWDAAGKAGFTTDPRVIAAKDARKKALAAVAA